jgi:hypothetical protein
MTFLDFLNALPTNLDKLCHEIATRTRRDRWVLLKKLLRAAFDSGRYNDPDRQRNPAPFMPHRLYADQLEVSEMEKWSGIWRKRGLNKESPVGPLVKQAVATLGAEKSNSIIDFGCGRGLALQEFFDQGLLPLGVDIASNALDERVAAHFPLLRACLWNLPDCLTAHYGYCTNVLEHIPEKKVDDSLLDMAISVRHGIFFQFELVGAHTYGKSPGWWEDTLRQRFSSVVEIERDEKFVQFVAD